MSEHAWRILHDHFGSVDPGAARQLLGNITTHLPFDPLWATIKAMNASPGQLGHMLGYLLSPNPHGDGLYAAEISYSDTPHDRIAAVQASDVSVSSDYLDYHGAWSEDAWPKCSLRTASRLVKLFPLHLHAEYERGTGKWLVLETVEQKERYLSSDDMGFRSLTLYEFLAFVAENSYIHVPVCTIGSFVEMQGERFYPLYYQDRAGKHLALVREPSEQCFYAVTPLSLKKRSNA